MTAFDKINVKALSTSSINKFRADPAAWWLSYVAKVRGATNQNMARGNAVEVGYDYFWKNEFATVDEAVDEAVKYYNRETALVVGQEKRDKERATIEPFVKNTIEAMSKYGTPTSSQNKLEITFDGVSVPVIGYDDYCFQGDDMPICLDLKTSHKIPSQMSVPHKRQMSLYQAMRPDHKILICYVSTKKYAVYELDRAEAEIINQEFKIAAQALERFLTICDDPMDLYKFFAPDYSSSFYWSDPITLSEAKRIWGY